MEPDGKRRCKSSGYAVGQEKLAARLLAELEERVAAGGEVMDGEAAEPKVRDFIKKWLKRRRATVRDWKSDEGRLEKHILPRIGHLPISQVRPRHIDAVFHALRVEANIAPHTLLDVYGLTKAAFRDAAFAGLIDSNPCILTATHLGADVYKDPVAQAECRYSRDQLASMVFSENAPMEGRLLAALGGMAGCRLGEIAGLR